MAEFTGIVEGIVFRNSDNGWTVLSLKQSSGKKLTAVGIMPFVTEGDSVVIEGDLVEHRDYGTQIKVNTCQTQMPETADEIESYLASGVIKGVGPSTAKLIVRQFGTETLFVLENQPDRLTEITGIGRKRAAMIAESFAEQNGSRVIMMSLQRLGLSTSLSMKIMRIFGEKTLDVLRDNPYRLCDEVKGIGFRTADEIAQSLGFAPDSPFRIRSGIRYVLTDAANGSGHMYLPFDLLKAQSMELLRCEDAQVDHALREMILNGSLTGEQLSGDYAVYLPAYCKAEKETARKLLIQRASICPASLSPDEIDEEIEAYEAETGVALCEKQRDAAHAAVEEGICIITGGPGTGKTTSINLIIRLMRRLGKVELCAPTGRAAKRMSESTGSPARTIHRLLEYNGEGFGFARNADEPLEADVVIVDEMSMVDIFLMRSLLDALKPGARLLLVGDADQLPSVGAGNVLRDLIAADVVRVVCLTEIFRQAQQSLIVVNAHRINHGEYPVIRSKDTDFFLERRENTAQAAASVIALVQTRLPKYLGIEDSLRGIQVMAPMKRGEAGVFNLNALLQQALNPPQKGKPELHRGDHTFRRGDKVMQVRNNYDMEWEREGESGQGAFNGDIGYIIGVDSEDGGLTIEFDDGRIADYTDSDLEDLELAYCMSVHKSQGSEFDAVVLPLLSGPPMLMTRNLLYTAVTRAKRLVVIVGREACVRGMIDNNQIIRRYSALDERLKTGKA